MTGLKDPISNKIFGSQFLFLFYCIVVVFFNEMNACIGLRGNQSTQRKPPRHDENIETPHRKASSVQDSN